jgi:hypothetical protein
MITVCCHLFMTAMVCPHNELRLGNAEKRHTVIYNDVSEPCMW